MPGTYQYEPGNIAEYGKDRMRFELGDTMVEGREKTSALSDEEYEALLEMNKNWKRAKLACIESILDGFRTNQIPKQDLCRFNLEQGQNCGKRSMKN